MNKENILKKIKANKPQWDIPLPQIPAFPEPDLDMVKGFEFRQKENKATVIHLGENDLSTLIHQQYPDAKQVLSLLPKISGNINPADINHPSSLSELDLAIIPGELGVADNGAIWVSSQVLDVRVIPFITPQLVIVLDKEKIVPKMHEAYQQINPEGLGFGVFISGPSKTADIEQSLVIGAHGPLGLMVVLR